MMIMKDSDPIMNGIQSSVVGTLPGSIIGWISQETSKNDWAIHISKNKRALYLFSEYVFRKSSVCFKKTLIKDTRKDLNIGYQKKKDSIYRTECQDWLLEKDGYARKGKKHERT